MSPPSLPDFSSSISCARPARSERRPRPSYRSKVWGLAETSSRTQPELLDGGRCGPFPFNVCLPQVSLSGDRLLVLGGEADMREVGGVSYTHDANFVVEGRLSVA